MDTQLNLNIQPEQPNLQPQKPANKTWQIAAIIVAGILVIGGVAYGAYEVFYGEKFCCSPNEVDKVSQNASPSVLVIASSSATPDETVGWQTYKNEQYGFEVRYPAGWVKEEQNNKIIFAEKVQSVKDNIIIAIQNNPNSLSARDFLISQGFDTSFIKESIDLQSYRGVKVASEGLCLGNSLYFAKGSNIISISACLEDKNIGDQILSTFKFTK